MLCNATEIFQHLWEKSFRKRKLVLNKSLCTILQEMQKTEEHSKCWYTPQQVGGWRNTIPHQVEGDCLLKLQLVGPSKGNPHSPQMHFKTKGNTWKFIRLCQGQREPTPDYSVSDKHTSPVRLSCLLLFSPGGPRATWWWWRWVEVAILPLDRAPVCRVHADSGSRSIAALVLSPGWWKKKWNKWARSQKATKYQICRIKEEVQWNWDFRQSSLILQASLYIVVNVCVFSLWFISSCQIVYNSRDKKTSGQPHLSQFTIPNNWIKETNQNELMRCVACLGLFLEPSLLSTVEAQAFSARQPLELQEIPRPPQLPLHTPHFVSRGTRWQVWVGVP